MPQGPVEDGPPTEGWPLVALGLGVASCLLFAAGLLVSEEAGEIALDIDLKPFFLPYLLIAVTRYGLPTLSVSVGAAAGEGLLDVAEGYELDDPIGFIGYMIGFTVFGWYLHRVAAAPTDRRPQAVAATLGASCQAAFEGLAFLVFTGASPVDTVLSVVGNTVTHGVVLGAIPLVLLYPAFAAGVADATPAVLDGD